MTSAPFDSSAACESVMIDTDKQAYMTRASLLENPHFQYTHANTTIDIFYHGNPDGSTLVTIHDVGQDPAIAFGGFLSYYQNAGITKHMHIYHIVLPGQLPDSTLIEKYPSFEEIRDCISAFISERFTKQVCGIGIGAGASLLLGISFKTPAHFMGLILINVSPDQMGWIEWITSKVRTLYTPNGALTDAGIAYFMKRMLGESADDGDDQCARMYLQYLRDIKDATNLCNLLYAFANRQCIPWDEPPVYIGDVRLKPLPKCPIMFIFSGMLPDVDQCRLLSEALPPFLKTTIEYEWAHGMILDQRTDIVSKAIFLFLQGQFILSAEDIPTPERQGGHTWS